jgi:hypothetical protein
MINLVSSDGSILVKKIPLCDWDLKINPDVLGINLLTEDTLTLDISGNGTALNKLKGDVKLSANPDNIITVDPAGGLLAIVPPPPVTCPSVYTNNGAAWATLADADAAFQALGAACKYVGYTILSYDEAGNEQEFWYKDGIATVNLIKKNDYSYSGGINSIAGGNPFNVAGAENAIALGRGVSTGFPYEVTAINPPPAPAAAPAWNLTRDPKILLIQDRQGLSLAIGDEVSLVNIDNGDVVETTITALAAFAGAQTIVTLAHATTAGTYPQFRLIRKHIDNTMNGVTVMGLGSAAWGVGAIALGRGAFALGLGAVAIGNASAVEYDSHAIGNGALAKGSGMALQGGTAESSGFAVKGTAKNSSFALGQFCSADGRHGYSSAFASGYNTSSTNRAAFTMGSFSLALNPNQFASGNGDFRTYNNNLGTAQTTRDHMVARTLDATPTNMVFTLDTGYTTGDNHFVTLGRLGKFKAHVLGTHVVQVIDPSPNPPPRTPGTVNDASQSTSVAWDVEGHYLDGTLIGMTVTPATGALAPSGTLALDVTYVPNGNLMELRFTVTGLAGARMQWYSFIEITHLTGAENLSP